MQGIVGGGIVGQDVEKEDKGIFAVVVVQIAESRDKDVNTGGGSRCDGNPVTPAGDAGIGEERAKSHQVIKAMSA